MAHRGHRRHAGAGGHRAAGAGVRGPVHHPAGGLYRGVELYALHRAGAGDHRVAGAAVRAGPGAAAAAAGSCSL